MRLTEISADSRYETKEDVMNSSEYHDLKKEWMKRCDERTQQRVGEKLYHVAENLDQLKAECDSFSVENILTNPADLAAYRKAKSMGFAKDEVAKDLSVDVTQQIENLNVQMEISRRFFNMLMGDLLQKSFNGVQVPELVQKIMEEQSVIEMSDIKSGKSGLSIHDMMKYNEEHKKNTDGRKKKNLNQEQNDNLILKKTKK